MRKYNQTAEQKAKSEERKQRFRAIAKQLADMSDAQRAELAARLIGITNVDGHNLSARNVGLIALQCPSATLVGGFRQWLAHGRCVRRGEHGLMIWVPITRKRGDVGADRGAGNDVADVDTRFIIGTIFDVSQTIELGEETAEQSADAPAADLAIA
jgi:hypothetical protein